MIDDRKRKVLQAIIEEYIKTALPISSNSLINLNDLNYSSATIRNDMAQLEKNGFIKKTHTSSGRVPSNKGYRFYVDELVKNANLTPKEIEYIQEMLKNKVENLEDLTQITAQIISEVTNYLTISIENDLNECIKEVKFVKLANNLLLCIILTQNDVIKETIIRYDRQIPDDIIEILTILFNEKLVGKKLSDINIPINEFFVQNIEDIVDIIKPILLELNKVINRQNQIHFEGTNNILKNPEFDNIENIKKLFEIFDRKQIINEIFNSKIPNSILSNTFSTISVLIGEELDEDILKDFSIITFSGDEIGQIGIVGPQRMDYAKVISVIEYINNLIEENNKRKKGLNGEK